MLFSLVVNDFPLMNIDHGLLISFHWSKPIGHPPKPTRKGDYSILNLVRTKELPQKS